MFKFYIIASVFTSIVVVHGQSIANICSGLEPNTRVRNVNDCEKYYFCFNGIPFEMKCEKGLLFDHITGLCDKHTSKGDCFKCPNSTFIDIPVSNQCNQFVRCFGSTAEQRTCADGLYFDPKAGMCNFRDEVKCVLTVECPRNTDRPWFIRDRKNCAKYHICLSGKPVEQQCPKKLYFNTVTNQCDHPKNTDCVSDKSTLLLMGSNENYD